jgi:hypothetical protein
LVLSVWFLCMLTGGGQTCSEVCPLLWIQKPTELC